VSWFFHGWLAGFLLACKALHYYQTGVPAALPCCSYLIAADTTADSHESLQHTTRVLEVHLNPRASLNLQQSSALSLCCSSPPPLDLALDTTLKRTLYTIITRQHYQAAWAVSLCRSCMQRGKGTGMLGSWCTLLQAIQDYAVLRSLWKPAPYLRLA
jgi:hypothetical protein